MNHNIICVVGPTASGKTKLAVELAKRYNGEVLSCDSMQIYRGMDIGTAKPTPEETDGIPHHMIDVVDPAEAFSVGRYVEMADPMVQDILSRGRTCVVCGGTGLYVDSLMAGRTFAPFPETGRRQALEQLADRQGIEAVMAILREVDPERAEKLHLSDRRRIIRAVEVWQETGKSLTQHDLETQALPPRYEPIWIGLDFENRADLYARIDLRVDIMMRDGLMEEIQDLLDRGTPPTATSLQAIGYKEPMAALRGEMTMDEAVDRIKQESRRYAKRQLTWLRRNGKINWIVQKAPLDFGDTLRRALEIVESIE